MNFHLNLAKKLNLKGKMQEIFVNIFYKFDFERQKMAEEKQSSKIITPLGWENKSQSLKVD